MIKVHDLHKSFGKKDVLTGVNMDIKSGSTHCIIGKSGCGKSVLLKHIVGLMKPDKGYVEVGGRKIENIGKKDLFEMRMKMGFVFQGAALFDSYNVYENIVLSLYEHGQKDDNVLDETAKKVLSSVGLLPNISEKDTEYYRREWEILKHKKPSDLSGGMRKRVGVARALVGEPEYIFYDEPTIGLDPVTSEQIDELIARLAEELNVTSVVITHDMFSVYRVADNVTMLSDGVVKFEGTAEELKNSNEDEVREFVERFS